MAIHNIDNAVMIFWQFLPGAEPQVIARVPVDYHDAEAMTNIAKYNIAIHKTPTGSGLFREELVMRLFFPSIGQSVMVPPGYCLMTTIEQE